MQELYLHKRFSNNDNINNNNNNINNNNNNNISNSKDNSMCKTQPYNSNNSNNNNNQEDSNLDGEEREEKCVTFERRPSMYFLLEKETMLLFRLAGFKLKPSQQERLYWNLLRLLNSLEDEGEEMKTCHAHEEKPKVKSHDTFDGGGYGIFWDEYHSIEQSKMVSTTVAIPDSEDGGAPNKEDKSEREIQWLNDVGFTNIAKKIRARREIDQNDDDMKIIAASLTRAQANAVRRRIDSLNEAIRQRKLNENPMPSKIATSRQRRHVKDIFNTGGNDKKTDGGDTVRKDVVWLKKSEVDLTSKDMTKASDLGRSQSLQVRPVVPPKPVAIPRQKSFGYTDSLQRFNAETSSPTLGNGCVQHLATAYERNNTPPNLNLSPVGTPQKKNLPPPLQNDNLVRRTSLHNLTSDNKDRKSPEPRPKSAFIPRENSADKFIFDNNENHEPSNNSNNYMNDSALRINDALRTNDTHRANDTLQSWETSSRRSPVIEQRRDKTLDADNSKTLISPASTPEKRRNSGSSDNSFIRNRVDRITDSQRKRLVVVDSTYINVSTVEESYTTVNRDNKPSMKKSSSQLGFDDASSTSSSNAVYQDDHISLKPYDSTSIDAELPQDLSSSSNSIVSPDATLPSKDHDTNVPTITQGEYSIDGNVVTTAKCKTKPSKDKPTDRDKTKERKKDKEKRKRHSDGKQHKSKSKHHHNDDSKSSTKDRPVAEHHDKPSIKNENITKTKLSSNTPSNSDDNRSIDSLGSVGSADDLPLSFINSRDLQGKSKTRHLYDSSTDSNCTTPEKGLTSIGSSSDVSLSPRTQSPQCLEGDAKLNFGSSSSPREVERTHSDAVHEPNFRKLPNFTLTKEELGLTHIGDLAEVDMVRIRSLALIELTALFDAYGIPMNRRKTQNKMKFKDHGTFGVALTTLCSREETKSNPTVIVPKIFREMLGYIENNGLREEGLLRVPGSTPRVKAFKEEADKHPDLSTLQWDGRKTTDISTCLKQFLRDLPVPLLSYEYQNTFTSVADLPDRKVQLQALNLLVLLLHPVHQETLKLLLVFLNKVVSNEAHNKMGLNNVAMIMAPNLFFHNNAKININEAQKAAGMTDVLRMLIKYQKILWTIPAFMVSQIRFLYDAGAKTKDPKALGKLIRRKKVDSPSSSVGITARVSRPGSSGEELEDFDENLIIRVKAPNLNKQSMAIQLSTFTTVAEVIAKFQWQRQKSQKEKDEIASDRLRISASEDLLKPGVADNGGKFSLYEVGGNIGERRLESTACISAILKENPNAEWVLKSEPV